MDLDLYVDMTIHVIYISMKSRKIEYFGKPLFLLLAIVVVSCM